MAEKKQNFDLADTHGVLNDMRDKSPNVLEPSKSNFLSTVRKQAKSKFVPTKLTNKNEFRALVLRNDTMMNLNANTRNNAAFVAFGVFSERQIFITATIPEMFGHLPLPRNAEDHATIDLYPKFGVTIDELPDARNLVPGDIIRVGFEDVKQRTNPVIYGIFKGGKDQERVDLYGECPPGDEATPNTQPARTPSNQTRPSVNPDPCITSGPEAGDNNDPEQSHLGIDFEAPPVSCGPALFENVFGVSPETASQEDAEEFDLIISAIQGKYPRLKPGMHAIYYQGRRYGKIEMIAVPTPYATKSYDVILPKENWPSLKKMLDSMYADFWYPRTYRQNRRGFFHKKTTEYDYSKFPAKYPGVPYPSTSLGAKKNRQAGFTAGCINSAFRSRAQQAYIRVQNAVISSGEKPANMAPKEWAREVAVACQKGITARTRPRSKLEREIHARDPSDPKGAPDLGGPSKRFTSIFDFAMNAASSGPHLRKSVAPPGFSIHQVGSAYDFNGFRIGKQGPQNNEAGRQMYGWMCRHSIFYGLIRTVNSEEWHFEAYNAAGNDKFEMWRTKNSNKEGYKGPPLSTRVSNYGGIDHNSEAYRAWADKARFAFATRKWHKDSDGSSYKSRPLGEPRDESNGKNPYDANVIGGTGRHEWTYVASSGRYPYPIDMTRGVGLNEAAKSPGQYFNQISKLERKKIEDEIGRNNIMAARRLRAGTSDSNPGVAVPNPTAQQITDEAGTQRLQDLLKTDPD